MLPTNEQLADIFATSTLMALSRSICVEREVLADLLGNDHDKRIMAERHLLAMLASAPAPAAPAADAPPENCRQRLAAEGKPYPRSSCAACGQFSPKWRECDAALAAHRAKGVV